MSNNKNFGQYSHYYDSLYKSKDYEQEVVFLESVIDKYSLGGAKSILSLGCGTCNHDIILAKKGYSITGIDQSSTMLEIAKEKIAKEKLSPKFNLINSDIRNMSVPQEHDLAMAMFNIIGYQVNNADLNLTLKSVHKALKPDGLFLFDCWYMPSVLRDRPTDRVKEISGGKTDLIRLTHSQLNLQENTIDINFRVLELEKNKIINDVSEVHTMRYWSIPEIRMSLENNGFELIKTCKFLDLNTLPDDNDWNMFVIAKIR